MAGEPEQAYSARDNQGRTAKPNPEQKAYSDENPDLLRWRADILMDEMMLGGVDVSGADGDRKPGIEPLAGAARSAPSSMPEGVDGLKNANGAYATPGVGVHDDGYRLDSPAHGRPVWNDGERAPWPESSAGDRATDRRVTPSGIDGLAQPDRRIEPRASWSSLSDDSMEGRGYGGYPDSGTWPPAGEGGGAVGHGSQAADWLRGQSANGQPQPVAPDGVNGGDPEAVGYASAMAVMPSGRKRSTLLPRMSNFDAEALKREINELHAEVAVTALPGSDTAERARHLLDKAYTILQTDPMRSAEVEYYMQQVRTIVLRMRQSRRWSNLYRDRLRVYLWAWVLLAVLMLVASYAFPVSVQGVVAALTTASAESLVVLNAAACLGAIFAGALGSAIGALVNMVRHARREQGFFDRKYGLRGLILPIIGALGGAILYALFGVFYLIAGIDVGTTPVAVVMPAAAAFALGYSQEMIYGTRA